MTLNTGIQATSSAALYTMAISFALFFFYRQSFPSANFRGTGCVLTFLLSLLTLHVFRAVLRLQREAHLGYRSDSPFSVSRGYANSFGKISGIHFPHSRQSCLRYPHGTVPMPRSTPGRFSGSPVGRSS